MTTSTIDLPKKVKCPVCERLVALTKKGYLWGHGGDGIHLCHGTAARVGYRYHVTDSTIDKVPAGTNLIYATYRGGWDQQDVVNIIEQTHDGGWAMEFLDAGLKFEGKWYRFDGTTEAEGRDEP